MWLSLQRRAHSFTQFSKVARVPIINVPELIAWKDSGLCGCNSYIGSSRRNSQVDPWRWSPENNVLARCRVFTRVTYNEAASSMDMN
eukprot:5147731-Pyramimonas_sp.AAC.1